MELYQLGRAFLTVSKDFICIQFLRWSIIFPGLKTGTQLILSFDKYGKSGHLPAWMYNTWAIVDDQWTMAWSGIFDHWTNFC